ADADPFASAPIETKYQLFRAQVDRTARDDGDLLRLHEHGLDYHLARADVDSCNGAVEQRVRVLRGKRIQLACELAENAASDQPDQAARQLARILRQQDAP